MEEANVDYFMEFLLDSLLPMEGKDLGHLLGKGITRYWQRKLPEFCIFDTRLEGASLRTIFSLLRSHPQMEIELHDLCFRSKEHFLIFEWDPRMFRFQCVGYSHNDPASYGGLVRETSRDLCHPPYIIRTRKHMLDVSFTPTEFQCMIEHPASVVIRNIKLPGLGSEICVDYDWNKMVSYLQAHGSIKCNAPPTHQSESKVISHIAGVKIKENILVHELGLDNDIYDHILPLLTYLVRKSEQDISESEFDISEIEPEEGTL